MKLFLSALIFLFQPGSIAAAYELKAVVVDGYSKPWIAVSAHGVKMKDIKEARIHFHGWTQDPRTGDAYSKYDFSWKDENQIPVDSDLRKFVEAYGMQREVEAIPARMILIPLARGHDDQYPELFDTAHFDLALTQVLESLGIDGEKLELPVMSAHSGAGEVISRLLEQAPASHFLGKVQRADCFDAIYSEETMARLSQWISTGSLRELRLFSIPKNEPAQHGDVIYQSLVGKESLKNATTQGFAIKSMMKTMDSGNSIAVIQETMQKLDHWSLVKMAWMF